MRDIRSLTVPRMTLRTHTRTYPPVTDTAFTDELRIFARDLVNLTQIDYRVTLFRHDDDGRLRTVYVTPLRGRRWRFIVGIAHGVSAAISMLRHCTASEKAGDAQRNEERTHNNDAEREISV